MAVIIKTLSRPWGDSKDPQLYHEDTQDLVRMLQGGEEKMYSVKSGDILDITPDFIRLFKYYNPEKDRITLEIVGINQDELAVVSHGVYASHDRQPLPFKIKKGQAVELDSWSCSSGHTVTVTYM